MSRQTDRDPYRGRDPGSDHDFSFFNLVELHVLAALRREHHVQMPNIRRAVDYVKKRLGSPRPLINEHMETDGTDIFVTKLGSLINVSQNGQLAMKALLQEYLKRIDRDAHGVAIRLFPFTRKRSLDEPKNIVIDPSIAFGRPAIVGVGIPTNIIAERYKAGESMDELADDYGCKRPHIEEAVRCELDLAA